MFLIGMVVGLFVGGSLGFFGAALCAAAKQPAPKKEAE